MRSHPKSRQLLKPDAAPRGDSSFVYFTCEVEGVGHGGHPHSEHGTGQKARSQAPGARPRDQQLRGVQIVVTTIIASSYQENLPCSIYIELNTDRLTPVQTVP